MDLRSGGLGDLRGSRRRRPLFVRPAGGLLAPAGAVGVVDLSSRSRAELALRQVTRPRGAVGGDYFGEAQALGRDAGPCELVSQ
jgi:hypothetical protein